MKNNLNATENYLTFSKHICMAYLDNPKNIDYIPRELLHESYLYLAELFDYLVQNEYEQEVYDNVAIYYGIINKIITEHQPENKFH